MQFLIAPPPYSAQVNNELTFYHNYEGDKVEEADQDEYRGGVCREGHRDRVEYKGEKNQVD